MLWIRSWITEDHILHYGPTNIYEVASSSGRLIASRTANPYTRVASFLRQGLADNAPWATLGMQDPSILREIQKSQPHWEHETTTPGDISKSLTRRSSLLGFEYAQSISYGDSGDVGDWIVVPHWAVASFASILPGIWVVRLWRANRRSPLGYCPTCGYDLRASNDRCPECGTPIRTNCPNERIITSPQRMTTDRYCRPLPAAFLFAGGRIPGMSIRQPGRVALHINGSFSKIQLDTGSVIDVPTDSIPPELRALGSRVLVTIDTGRRTIESQEDLHEALRYRVS